MRIAVETQFAAGTPTGLGVYAQHLFDALRRRTDLDAVALEDRRFDLWRFDRRLYWDQVRAPALVHALHADVVHFTGGTMPVFGPRRAVVTVHDLVWMRRGNRGRAYMRWYFGTLQPSLVRRASAIVVDTQAARIDVADGLDVPAARITVAGAGVDASFFSVERRPQTSPPIVLSVGTVEERKDLITAVRALALVPDVRLVSVGPHTAYAVDVMREAVRLGVADRVELRGFVDAPALLELYARAAVLAYPSHYEGFGLPPLQAQAAGLPVVAARVAVTEEVLGEHAWYAQAGDDVAFAAALTRVLRGGPEVDTRIGAARERARGFTWDAVADRMAGVYRSLA